MVRHGVGHTLDGLQGLDHVGLTAGAHHALDLHCLFHGNILTFVHRIDFLNVRITLTHHSGSRVAGPAVEFFGVADVEQIQPQSICHHAEAGQGHGRRPEHGIQLPPQEGNEQTRRQGDAQGVVAEGPEQILADVSQGGAGEADGGGYVGQAGLHQHHVGGIDGHIGSRPDGDAHVGAGQSGSVVDAVPHHGYLAVSLQVADHRLLAVGKHPRDDVARLDPCLAGDGGGSLWVVTRQHDHPKPQPLHLTDGGGRVLLHGVRHGDHTQKLLVSAEEQGRLTLPRIPLGGGQSGGRNGRIALDQIAVASSDHTPLHKALQAPPGQSLEARHRQSGQPRFTGVLHDGGGQGMLAHDLQGVDGPQGGGLVPLQAEVGHTGLALGHGARLVQHHGIHPPRILQRDGGLEQDAVFRAHAVAHHDGHGGRYPNGKNPIYSMVIDALFKHKIKVNVLEGIYGIGGKEFTPNDAISVYYNMRDNQVSPFSVGINDDINNNSLTPINIYNESSTDYCIRIYGMGGDGSVSSAKSIIKIMSQNGYAQGYFDYDSKKSGSVTISHIRSSTQPINKPFNCQNVNVVVCNNSSFLKRLHLTDCLIDGGTLIINCPYTAKELNEVMLNVCKKDVRDKNLKVYIIDADKIALKNNLGNKTNNIMQLALWKSTNLIPYQKAFEQTCNNIKTLFARKGEEVVKNNLSALKSVEKSIKLIKNSTLTQTEESIDLPKTEFYEKIFKPISKQQGNTIPVSAFTSDGSMPTDTSKFEKRGIASEIPCWHAESCIQCGRCSIACPHASLRPVIFDKTDKTPNTFTSKKAILADGEYRMQVEPLDCTGCGVCSQVCPMKGKAITMESSSELKEIELKNQEYAYTLPQRQPFEPNTVKGLQFSKPYFEYSGACAGCGETPYIKMLTQLFGDRMLIANATGCSSIYGGTYPSCPYTKDGLNLGPAWANSLFEDNAEFGYGIMLASKEKRENFINTLKQTEFSNSVQPLVNRFLQDTDNHKQNRELLQQLNLYFATRGIEDSDKYLYENLGQLIKPSTWIIGGDGWAYDIGFGGLDHVIASGENVNILVLDTEIYSNTGGQTSKSTPRGASAKFNQTGKTTKKKDLATMMMAYKDVYVAQISMGANPDQAIKAFIEAENYNGPSLILAYSPCVSHGYDLKYSQTHAFTSVSSGYNTLFRYNPNAEPCMQVDSVEPFSDYNEYVNSENRFKVLGMVNPTMKDVLLEASKQDALTRRKNYVNKSKEK